VPASWEELLAALPSKDERSTRVDEARLRKLFEGLSYRALPTGRLQRFALLNSLHARIATAYLFHWLRGWFHDASENERHLVETHSRNALRVLRSMSYLRGAVMKVGQTLAHLPNIVPQQFIQMLERLHFDAPPMHWSLLKEMVLNDLGDPRKVFASFETQAFAAASLGQVHRARLKSGERVAVKIQYPGIGRTIRSDIQNFLMCLRPACFNRDWQNIQEQFEDLRLRLERETDYENEASFLVKARSLFRPEDGIVVPRVFHEYCTPRVLTMEWLPGVHLDQFLATNPSQQLRNEFAKKILRASNRMTYTGRLLYPDMHPGNFLFMDNGQLGIIDFGFMLEIDDELWDVFRKMDRSIMAGRRDERIAAVKQWSSIGDDPVDEQRISLSEQFADWSWRCRYLEQEFDFSDEVDFRRGINLFIDIIRNHCTSTRPATHAITRQQFGFRSLLFRLQAKLAAHLIAEQEIKATGWDRREYVKA